MIAWIVRQIWCRFRHDWQGAARTYCWACDENWPPPPLVCCCGTPGCDGRGPWPGDRTGDADA